MPVRCSRVCLLKGIRIHVATFASSTTMATAGSEQHWITRVNQQVNYRRTFHGPEKVVVSIPTLPYQAFDKYFSGTRIKPWNLIDLVVSVRLFTQYPVQHSGNKEDSIVDNHRLQKDNFLFVVALKMDINRTFHNPESPKFPLMADVEVTHAGKSSLRRVVKVTHPNNQNIPYFTCETDDVFVDRVNRRPAAFPEWWIQKYSHLIRSKTNYQRPTKGGYMFANKSEITVEFDHLDHNLHTTMSAYLRICINVAFKTAVNSNRGHFGLEHLRAGVKCIQMFFDDESNYGDTLLVEAFENKSKLGELYIEIRKRLSNQEKEIECCSVVLEYYEPGLVDIGGKL